MSLTGSARTFLKLDINFLLFWNELGLITIFEFAYCGILLDENI